MQRLLLLGLQRLTRLPRWLGVPGVLLLLCGMCCALPLLLAYLLIRHKLGRWLEYRQLARLARASRTAAAPVQ